MRIPRIHVPGPLAPGEPIALPEGTARHLARVLRLRPGDTIVLFDGRGGEHAARLESGAVARVGEHRAREAEPPLELVLVQGISRGERMDLVVQKAVELGVARIEPVITARSVVRLDPRRAAARREHWQRVVVGACEQCGRNRVPEVAPIRPLAERLDEPAGRGLRLVLDPEAPSRLADLAPPDGALTLLVGPEGGFDPAERALALGRGWRALRLGPRILRTETAALVALAAMQLAFGDLGG